MNLFILSNDKKQLVMWMMDKHIVKIILEAVQMLCTAYRVILPNGDHVCLYKQAHLNHPVCKWVRESYDNFVWTLDLVDEMHAEWRYRYKHPDTKFHKSYLVAQWIREHMPQVSDFSKVEMSEFKLAMPDIYKTSCPFESYRNYYKSEEKRKIASWKNREVPLY